MNDFIDLKGASGVAYRFRRSPDGQFQLPIAGNYAYVQGDGAGFKVLVLGETPDLSRDRAGAPKGPRRAGAHLYTRLNVSRAVRMAEHEDLAAHYAAARVVSGSG
ncbi:MAG TPA: hypothetical protein VLI41_05635 [Phenylobacterium sp.]|uniref:hypothetical protein n=1 Tax=Phenylobacterium sp. TaxID=1871053 RepID=UPI002C1E087E|nr:hypothetical protein [Phenylobacterium sp.]HSV02669.1 hypothetical protein [Phenylobacterium sp.]